LFDIQNQYGVLTEFITLHEETNALQRHFLTMHTLYNCYKLLILYVGVLNTFQRREFSLLRTDRGENIVKPTVDLLSPADKAHCTYVMQHSL